MRIYGLFSNREYNLSAVDPGVTKWLAWWMRACLAFVTLSLNREAQRAGGGDKRRKEMEASIDESRMYRTNCKQREEKQTASEKRRRLQKKRENVYQWHERDGGGGKWRGCCRVTSYLVCNSRAIHLPVYAFDRSLFPIFQPRSKLFFGIKFSWEHYFFFLVIDDTNDVWIFSKFL